MRPDTLRSARPMRRGPEQKGSAVIDAWRGARAMMGPATFGKKLHAKVSAKGAGAFTRRASAIVSPRAELTRIFAQLESCLPREALVALSEGMAAARAPDSSQAVGDPRPVALGEECWSLMEILVEQLYDPDEQAPPRDPSFGRAQISRSRCARHARRLPQSRRPSSCADGEAYDCGGALRRHGPACRPPRGVGDCDTRRDPGATPLRAGEAQQ